MTKLGDARGERHAKTARRERLRGVLSYRFNGCRVRQGKPGSRAETERFINDEPRDRASGAAQPKAV